MSKILVVDDQLGIRCLFIEILKEDHEVEVAANGSEAFRLLISFKPDLILLDMKMPGMNGIETLEQIRAVDCRVAVIMMSSYGNSWDLKQVKDLGILYYMVKPFDLFELRERVREMLNSHEVITKRSLCS